MVGRALLPGRLAVTAGRRQLVLLALGIAVLVLGIVVAIRNGSPDDELLAVGIALTGAAVILVAVPTAG